jgi:uncharacterized protein (DUF2062 family)
MPDNPAPIPPEPARTFWQRRVRDPVVAQLTQGITPEKIALTVAIGSTLAMFPILGTTSLLCLVAGILLRLNQPLIQAVNYLCTPIHLIFIPLSLHWGERLFGVAHSRLEFRSMLQLVREHPLDFLHNFWLAGFHAVVVWAICTPFWITAVYYSAAPILREIVRARAKAAAQTVDEPPPTHPIP